jgi:hypothetical protein
VAVRVERQGHLGVPQELSDHPRVFSRSEEQRRRGVPKVVRAHSGEPSLLEGLLYRWAIKAPGMPPPMPAPSFDARGTSSAAHRRPRLRVESNRRTTFSHRRGCPKASPKTSP